MEEIKKKKIMECTIECTATLCKAIQEAGGTIRPNTLLAMSIKDFIIDIASPNNIEFVYVNKKERKGI